MKWWEKPRPVEDIRLMAWHALLRDPDSVESYVMVNGKPVYPPGRGFRKIRKAIQATIPAFEQLGEQMQTAAEQFAEFTRASYKQHGVRGLHLP